MDAAHDRFQFAAARTRVENNATDQTARSFSPQPTPGGPVTMVFMVASVLLSLWTSWGENIERMSPFLISLSPTNAPERLSEVMHGEVWRLFTPTFLHFSVEHLGFNLLGMYNLGQPLERVIGSRPYLSFSLVLALLTDLGQYYISGEPYFGGLSGVFYGLFGYVWLRGWCDSTFPLYVPRGAIVIAVIGYVAGFTGVFGPIGNASHTVGLLAGAIWGIMDGRNARQTRVGQPAAGEGNKRSGRGPSSRDARLEQT